MTQTHPKPPKPSSFSKTFLHFIYHLFSFGLGWVCLQIISVDSLAKISPNELKLLDEIFDLVQVEPGDFLMGSPDREPGRNFDESLHKVRITQPFWISAFEITNKEWNNGKSENFKKGSPIFYLTDQQIDEISGTIGRKGGYYALVHFGEFPEQTLFLYEAVELSGNWQLLKGGESYEVINRKLTNFDDMLEFIEQIECRNAGRLDGDKPVTHVSYSQAVSFCWDLTSQLREEKRLPRGMIVRLPTEAEWEYACRAGKKGICGLGEGDWLSGENANFDGSSPNYVLGKKSSKAPFIPLNRGSVSQINPEAPKYPCNDWGVYDMHGNVMEWCYDYYAAYKEETLTIDPIGPIFGTRRVVRGGSFYRTAQECRSASRAAYEPSYRGSEIGFRIVIGFPVR